MVGVQMREEYVYGVRIGVPLQRTEHAATEIED